MKTSSLFQQVGACLRPILAVCSMAALVSCGGGANDAPSASRNSTAKREQAMSLAVASLSQWSSLTTLTMVPISAANLPNGKVLLWSSSDQFADTPKNGFTYTTLFDPVTLEATDTTVSVTGHDMFCSGTTNLPDGRLLVNGGKNDEKTSIYDPATDSWVATSDMLIPRGYNANTLLADGSVLTFGGSWSGAKGGKHAELWTQAGGWRRLTGVPVDSALAMDPQGVYRGDNHMWLIPSPNGQVLHAGPSANMNWIETQGNGRIYSAGVRGDDDYSQGGNAVMYDIGKVLKVGGAPAYQGLPATTNSYVIDVNAGVSVRKVAPMSYARIFSNAVVLPNGQVVVLGGHTVGSPYSDDNSVLVPELWDPATETFTPLPAMASPRNYHSVALLLPDGRVMSAGGGLCGGCSSNHPDVQILSPHYLYNSDGTPATRPVLLTAPQTASHGTSVAVTTDSEVSSFALVRLSSATHTVNNDQRRIPLSFSRGEGNAYVLDIPSNPNVVLPGHYMLFAMNASGVPSVSRTLRISGDAAPRLSNPGSQSSITGLPVNVKLQASTPTGELAFSASGLPPGLAIDGLTGEITGISSTLGAYVVTVYANNGVATTSTQLAWSITEAPTQASWVMLEAVSETNGNAWASMAEFNLVDRDQVNLSRVGWSVQASSQQTDVDNEAASAAIDGDPETLWHTRYLPALANPPHRFIVNLGEPRAFAGFRYLPRPNPGVNGIIAGWRFYASNDGAHWTLIKEGNFNDLPDKWAEKTVMVNRPPAMALPTAKSSVVGRLANVSISAGDPDGDGLTYSAKGLPDGLSIGATSGVISGWPTTVGSMTVSVTVSDGQGGSTTQDFIWRVTEPILAVAPVLAPPIPAGSAANFSAQVTGGQDVSFRWNFGDGSPVTAYSASGTASHVYESPGLYKVTVSAMDSDGMVRERSFTQAIHALPTALQGRASSSMAIESTAQGHRVWMVNQDNESVSVFEGSTQARVAEVPVGVAPRSVAVAPDGRVWVTNKESATISVIDPASLKVVQTVPLLRAGQPHGLVFAPDGSAAYVVLEARGVLMKLDPKSGAYMGMVNVGANPRHLSMLGGSDKVLVSRFISSPLPGESTGVVRTQVDGVDVGGEVVVVTSDLLVERKVVLHHSDKPDGAIQGRGLPNYLVAAVISPDGRSAWVASKQDNIMRGKLRDGLDLDFQNTVRAISSRIDLAGMTEDLAGRVDLDNASVASAAVFHPTGAYLFVALQTSQEVAVVDPVRKAEIFRFAVGMSPDALAVSPDGLTLYVNNFMDRTLGVHDLSKLVTNGEFNVPTVASVAAIDADKLTPQVLLGKRLFYDARDPRLTRDAYLSCASCHSDGGHDGRTWDFTGMGEGLRNTISLRGRAGGQGLLHWSGNFDEVQDFEGQIRALAGGRGLMSDDDFHLGTRAQPLGDAKAGVSADLDALNAYLKSLDQFAPSPMRNSNGALSTSAQAGRSVFAGFCASCHGGGAFTDSAANNLHDIGTLKPSSGQRLGGPLSGVDTPTLRDVWATAPYLHDGSATTIDDAVRAHKGVSLSDAQISDVSAYVAQIGREEASAPMPEVGVSNLVVLDAANAVDWSLRANLQVGDLQYGDRAYLINIVPSRLVGASWIRTANDSRLFTGNPTVRFTLSQAADVYVAVESKGGSLPWLTGWADTGMQMRSVDQLFGTTITTRTYRVYSKRYASGVVSLGNPFSGASGPLAPLAAFNARAMYMIMVK
jgi:YVTN family beta-propeller protein